VSIRVVGGVLSLELPGFLVLYIKDSL
jgi:hypothetical protein